MSHNNSIIRKPIECQILIAKYFDFEDCNLITARVAINLASLIDVDEGALKRANNALYFFAEKNLGPKSCLEISYKENPVFPQPLM